MRPYSVDLRQRIVEAVEVKKMSKAAVAELYGVSRATVYRYLDLAKEGDLSPKQVPGPAPHLDEAACQKLLEQLEKHNDLSLEEHAIKFSEAQGIPLKKSAIGKYFSRLGVRMKKKPSVRKSEMTKQGKSGLRLR